MNKKQIMALLDTWLSKKWIAFLLCFIVGTYKSVLSEGGLTTVDAGFYLSMAAFYHAANTYNKAVVLRSKIFETKEEFAGDDYE